MISSLTLVNFKCFKQPDDFSFGSLNVFAGVNGSGKSTVLQSLLALKQSINANGNIARLLLRGPLTDLGTVGEVYCADPISDEIEIRLTHADGAIIDVRSVRSKDRFADTSSEYVLPLAAEITAGKTNLLTEPFNYLHAERIGPRKVFDIPSQATHPLCVGKWGENAPYIIASGHRLTSVTNEFLLLPSSDGREFPTLEFQCRLWMARLFPGFDQKWDFFDHADQGRLEFALQTQETGVSLYVRPTNTGFGLSFVLGIVVAGLVALPATILIVENPEAHLHPKAQSSLGEFLGRVAAGGTQIFVETHSEHILNGIRRMIKQTILSPELVKLYFFAKRPQQLEPSVDRISISPSGDFSAWPDGFFDQLDKDLSVILS